MSHAFTHCTIHCIWATKFRQPWLDPILQARLWPYLGGIARKSNVSALAVGGAEDHVHVLARIPPALPVSRLVMEFKGLSSKWIHDYFPRLRDFAWQQGYGAFSVSRSQEERIIAYIQGQKEHHQKKSLEKEMGAFLERHGIPFDPKKLWE